MEVASKKYSIGKEGMLLGPEFFKNANVYVWNGNNMDYSISQSLYEILKDKKTIRKEGLIRKDKLIGKAESIFIDTKKRFTPFLKYTPIKTSGNKKTARPLQQIVLGVKYNYDENFFKIIWEINSGRIGEFNLNLPKKHYFDNPH